MYFISRREPYWSNYIGVAFRDIGLPNLTPYLPKAVVMFIPLVQDACIVIPLTIHLPWVIEAGGCYSIRHRTALRLVASSAQGIKVIYHRRK